MKYIFNKLFSYLIIIVAVFLGLISLVGGNRIWFYIAIILAIAGVYFWKHSPF